MPKQLKIHPNERIDITDFLRGSTEYTQESMTAIHKRLLLTRESLFLDGFRIELADQTANPGQLTVYNGNAIDHDGFHLNNEDQINTGRTITLGSPSTTYYLEVQYTESDTDTDARAFWDPTYANSGAIPDGREFTLNVATRIAQDWEVVTPVSTTAFTVTSTPSSTRVPVAKIITDGTGKITTAVNPNLSLVPAADVLAKDFSIGDTSLRLTSTRIFPDTGTITVDYGGSSAESVNITANDREEQILTISPALSNNQVAGAIVRLTSGSGRWVKERVSSTPVSADIDHKIKFFGGDEYTGVAYSTSKDDFGERDDNGVRSIKDYVDFISAQIREMKFGSMRPDSKNQAPPSAFSAEPRYFESAGGIQGARGAMVTIGDGTTTFGDFNGTDETPFIDAAAALANNGGVLYVKNGTYTIGSTVNFSATKPVHIVGDGTDATDIDSQVAAGPVFSFSAASICSLSNLSVGTSALYHPIVVEISSFGQFVIRNCVVGGSIDAGDSQLFYAENTRIAGASGANAVSFSLADTEKYFVNCNISAASDAGISGTLNELYVSNCKFTGAGEGIHGTTSATKNVHISNCIFTVESSAIEFDVSATNVHISNCTYAPAATLSLSDHFFQVGGPVTRVDIIGCKADVAYTGTSVGSKAFLIRVDGGADPVRGLAIQNCNLTSTDDSQYVTALQIGVSEEVVGLSFSDCVIEGFQTGVNVDSTSSFRTLLNVRGCLFEMNTAGPDRTGVSVSGSINSEVVVEDSDIRSAGGYTIDSSLNQGYLFVENCFLTGGDGIIRTHSSAEGTVIRSNYLDMGTSETGAVEAIYVSNNGAFFNGKILIEDNTLDVFAGSSADAAGIRLDTVENAVVRGNHIVRVVSGSAGFARGISVEGGTYVIVKDNVINGVGASGAVGADTADIYLLGSDIQCSDNVLNTEETYGIRYEYDGDTDVLISGNVIHMGLQTQHAIHADQVSGGTNEITRLKIYNNTASGFSYAGTTSAIFVNADTGSDVVEIVGNVIQETTFNAGHQGIEFTGGPCDNIRVDRNSILGVVSGSTNRSATTRAIDFDCVAQVGSISNNVIQWCDAGFQGQGIYLNGLNSGIITGNSVLPDASGGRDEILTGASSNNCYGIANIVGVSGRSGTVNFTAGLNNTAASNKLN